MPWFSFSLNDFAFAFLSILLEGVPFLLLGAVVSGIIDAFLPSRVMTRLLPGKPGAAILLSGFLGVIFPMCECGIVPVIRRLMRKGLPVSCGVTYMLSAPIVNPVVALSTYAAFRGQGPELMMLLRIFLGAAVAILAGYVAHALGAERLLNKPMLSLMQGTRRAGVTLAGQSGLDTGDLQNEGFIRRIAVAVRVAAGDFLDVAVYLVIGAAITSVFNTGVRQDLILPVADQAWLAVPAMMGLAGILSLCSTSDAFIAATFVAFPMAAKLAFLVFGPMMDIKLIFLYSVVFRKRVVAGLAVGLFVVIGLLSMRIHALNL